MNLSEAVDLLVNATLADGRSARTAGSYASTLAPLVAFLGPERAAAEVTVADLRAYLAHLRGQSQRYADHPGRAPAPGGLAAATIAGRVRSLKRLFKFLHEEGEIALNPARQIRQPRAGRGGQPKAITAEDVARLLAAAAGEDAVDRRDRAVVLFLADTGCRAGGLVGLRLGDLQLEGLRAQVMEKGEKVRLVFFSPVTAEGLAAWLSVRPASASEHVFLNLRRPGEGLTVKGLEEILRRLGRRAGCTGPHNPHAFRHGFAREFLQSGGNLGQLADLLGHSSVLTTWQSYAIFNGEELAAQHAQHSPMRHYLKSHNGG